MSKNSDLKYKGTDTVYLRSPTTIYSYIVRDTVGRVGIVWLVRLVDNT